MKKLLVTGSNGLIGSEVVAYFDDLGWEFMA
jgi:nucleoside-diphosphate-sugar epimerase